jgi:hypothetical protein
MPRHPPYTLKSLATFIDRRQIVESVGSRELEVGSGKRQAFLADNHNLQPPKSYTPTSLPQEESAPWQIHSGRACRDVMHPNSPSVATCPPSAKALLSSLPTSNSQLPTHSDSSTDNGSISPKRCPTTPTRAGKPQFLSRTAMPFAPDGKTGGSLPPIANTRAWERLSVSLWVGVADGLQAILNSRTQI